LPYQSEKAKPYLSVVVPAFNEEQRIPSTLDRLVAYLDAQEYSWEVIVVDDGSTDATAAVASEWAVSEPRVRVESIEHTGKGWAVRKGMLAATGHYRFMCDADLAMPIGQLGAFVNRGIEGYDVVVGSRQIEGARRFNESYGRHFRGRLFNWLVRLIAVRGFQDTQCGFKYFAGDAAERLFGLQMARGLGFDIEILRLAQKGGMRILEMPIDWYHQSDGKVRPLVDPLAMLGEAVKVRIWELQGKYR